MLKSPSALADKGKAIVETLDSDRRTAEWAIGMGGSVLIVAGGQEFEAKVERNLPSTVFHVVQIDVSGRIGVNDQSLQNIKDLVQLRSLNVNNTQITDEGVVYLTGLANHQGLGLNDAAVTDSRIQYLTGLNERGGVSLRDKTVIDAAAKPLRTLPYLREVDVRGTRVTAAGVAKLFHAMGGANPAVDADPVVSRTYFETFAQEDLRKGCSRLAGDWIVAESNHAS